MSFNKTSLAFSSTKLYIPSILNTWNMVWHTKCGLFGVKLNLELYKINCYIPHDLRITWCTTCQIPVYFLSAKMAGLSLSFLEFIILGVYDFVLVLTHLLTLFVSALGKQKPSSGPHWNIKAIKNLWRKPHRFKEIIWSLDRT